MRNPQVGDPRAQCPKGFELLGDEMADDPIVMTREEFVDYQLSVSHCVAAVERGTRRTEVRAWLTESLAPLDGDASTRTLEFLCTYMCLRRIA